MGFDPGTSRLLDKKRYPLRYEASLSVIIERLTICTYPTMSKKQINQKVEI